MWWKRPRRKDFRPVLPDDVLDVVVRSYALVEVGGVTGSGPERGRNFENTFYTLCGKRGVHLCERAGSRTLAEQRSASGFMHEVDAGTRTIRCVTSWELKHLSVPLEKNELLVFNGKALDFLQGSTGAIARIPFFRFLLSGNSVRDECRHFAALWGINIIEPHRLPLVILYEAVARGGAAVIRPVDCEMVKTRVAWACRSLQSAVTELADFCSGRPGLSNKGVAARASRAVADAQEQIGADLQAFLDEHFPDWVDDVAEETWREIGGW
jgi:hypothetical protein